MNAEIRYDQTRYRTVEPGRVTAHAAGKLSARNLGKVSYLSVEEYYGSRSQWKDRSYSSGDSFEYLQSRAEGGCLIRRQSHVFEVDGCAWLTDRDDDLVLSSPPQNEWWIHVIDEDHQPLGWLLVDNHSVDFLPREF